MSADDIRREIDLSRRAIQRDYASLRAELDFVAKTKRAVVEHPLPWLGGSALIGWVLSGRKRRKARKLKRGEVAEPVKRFTLFGILLTVARLIFPLVQPQLTNFAIGRLTTVAEKFRR
jgi:hypothetical protein